MGWVDETVKKGGGAVSDGARELGGDVATGVKSWGKGFADMNPFKGPDLKDVPDPTAPANLERPSMGNMQAGTVSQPGSFTGATLATVKDPKAALIAQSQQAQFRDQQSTLAAQLANQAAGIGPSVSGMQLKQGQEANLAATMAQQNSMRGGANPAMARATMQTAAEIQGKAAQEAAQARLQEQLAAQGLLNQVASGSREQDVQLATSQANLTQQANMQKYQGDLQLAVEQGKLDQQTASQMFEQANQNARLDAELGQKFQQLTAQYASMGLDADKANMLASLEIEKMKAGAIQAQNANTSAAHAAKTQMIGNVLSAGASVFGTMYGGPAGGALAGGMTNQYGQQQASPQPGDGNFVGPPR